MQARVENGLQLLARLRPKQNLRELEPVLFNDGVQINDVVEINGEERVGKTLVLSHLLAKCILPSKYQDVQIQGCDSCAVLINTDHRFEISRLVKFMSSIVQRSFVSVPQQGSFKAARETIINNSLKNLILINCYDRDQFMLTIHTLEDIVLGNDKIAVLAIDSISAFYWQDRESNGVWYMHSYIRNLIKTIKSYTFLHNVVTMYTTINESSRKAKDSVQSVEDNCNEKNSHKICLRRIDGSEKLSCLIKWMQQRRRIDYVILEDGIKWCTDKASRTGCD